MNRRRFLAALAVAATLAGAARAHEYVLGDLQIAHPHAVETPASATSGAGYLAITNTGHEPDRLIAIRTTFPQALIHATETDAQGVARMRALDSLEIPPGATVTLAPGGMHVMFMGIDQQFRAGDRIPATLVFEKAGEIQVMFNVEPRTGDAEAGGMDHDMPGMKTNP